ncbi:LysM peptidoglycan-binding domain-containing protein [Anaeromicropila populeti]|uniref:LysM domain-containing protein n=1 Tax=Anaeromicropila populeti TaxID=37658 RepID=A0A1I6JSZ7_9FIRM|nr:LysM peptidoglycan-binding domain-containing protein [Anaeromicropila populeti]SFR82114.1 LysM domain-containing protein [Anaeromicropila populeti]
MEHIQNSNSSLYYVDDRNKTCQGLSYTIQKGDTLYGLSRRYNIPLSDIMSANPDVDVYNLQIDTNVCIPLKSSAGADMPTNASPMGRACPVCPVCPQIPQVVAEKETAMEEEVTVPEETVTMPKETVPVPEETGDELNTEVNGNAANQPLPVREQRANQPSAIVPRPITYQPRPIISQQISVDSNSVNSQQIPYIKKTMVSEQRPQQPPREPQQPPLDRQRPVNTTSFWRPYSYNPAWREGRRCEIQEYVVRREETIQDILDMFGMSLEEFLRYNKLRDLELAPRTKVYVRWCRRR